MIVAWARGMRHLLGVGAEHAHDAGDGRCHAVTIDRHRDAVNGTEVMAEPANLSNLSTALDAPDQRVSVTLCRPGGASGS